MCAANYFKNTKEKVEFLDEYFGQVGKRCVEELTFIGENGFDSAWGTTFIIRLLTNDKRLLVWKTSHSLHKDVGQKFSAKFTIKDHAIYREKKQTLITRLQEQA